ncbi:uncharacterized protein LOC107703449 isoform X2 [Sinocyclocheilus anshuiensis]|uniref:uncharacterized protein LOC107703449 isoform X2 n=1 Tax=Sinocyclocheilus anshuiensis TaxID=1608454 RepID=UPI0007B7C414|nr:PREDICTED: uncharacterized protein LOC107703449 isoform X2 [Sinocyclocheilus anshuiensis]
MFKRFNLLLLFCFIYQSGAPPVGTSTISVSGKKRDNVTLPCQFETKKISDISLNNGSENIPVCQTEECSGRVFKKGNCDVVFKNLSFSDAGTYFLHVYYNNDQTKLRRQIRTYQLHIHDEVSVKTGEEHKLDVLSNANQVVHWTRNKTNWREVWSRSNGAQSDQLTDTDGTLSIKEFTANDAGTYRVLDYEGEILITVTVTESDTESKEKYYNTDDDKTDNTRQHSVWFWIMIVGLTIVLLVLALIMLPVIKKQFLKKRVSY